MNERQTAGHELYYQLVWQIFGVKCCPKHQRLLSSRCPHCQSDFSPLRANTHPGYCPKCRSWLAETNHSTPVAEWDKLTAAAIAGLLQDRQAHDGYTPSHFPANVRQLLDGHFDGNAAALKRFLAISRTTVIAWLDGRERPSLEYLATVSLKVKVPMAALLYRPLRATDFQPEPTAEQQPPRRFFVAPPKVSLTAMRQEMERVIHANPPLGMSLNAIANRLGCNQTTLKRRFPELAEAVKQRYLANRKARMDTRVQEVQAEVKATMLALYHAGIYPSQARLRAKLWGRIDLREPSAQQTWKRVLSELYPARA